MEFSNTIFLNKSSSLKKQIDKLKQIREEVPDYYIEKVDYVLKMLENSLEGEKRIASELKKADIGMYVLCDITLKYEDLNVQFDYIVVTKGYVYLIECKNLIGNIEIDSNGQFTREYKYKKDKYKENIYSPYTIIVNNKNILKKMFINKNSKLRVFKQEKSFDNLWYKPLVVVPNDKLALNKKDAPKEVKKNTICVDELINYIKKDIDKYDSTYYESKEYMNKLANSFLDNNIRYYHNITDNYNEILMNKEIESKLKHFRKNKSKKKNIPIDYIFTDDELKIIIKNKPTNIDDLKEILSDRKVKNHGKDIVKIVNSSR